MAGNITKIDSDLGSTQYGYDKLSRLTHATPDHSLKNLGLPQEQYSYDPVGNRTASSHQPGVWSYNADNQLIQYPRTTPFSGAAAQDTSVSYTLQGHAQEEKSGAWQRSYRYNAAERLIETNQNGQTTSYRYDPFGRRISKTTGSGAASTTTSFLYSDTGLLAEADSQGQLSKAYGFNPKAAQQGLWSTDPIWQADVTNNSLTNGATSYHYLHTDHLATPVLGTDKAGNPTWKGASEAFGATKPTIQATEMNLRFPGQYWDRETNSHYNFNRDYLPQIGRYLQSDPIGLKDGVNLFAYVVNRPLGRIDPSGLANSGAINWGKPKKPQIEEECCGKIPELKDDLINACALLSTNIKDLGLRQCMQERCKTGTVTCDGFWCWRLNFSSSSETYGWNFVTSNANLCVSANSHIDQHMGWGCVVIHEWAHSCGWQHKGGQNIPDGTNGLDEFLSVCRSRWNPANKGPGRY